MRSAIEVQETCLPPAEKQAIARSISHSNETAEKHYRALDQGKTMLAYKSVRSILGVPVPDSQVQTATSTPKRHSYTPQETALTFERHIARKIMQSIEEA